MSRAARPTLPPAPRSPGPGVGAEGSPGRLAAGGGSECLIIADTR